MGRFDNLLEQLYDKDFNNMRFTVYNFIDSDGYVNEISALKHERLGIEDFSFMVFDISDEDKHGIKSNDSEIIQKYKDFKHYIEKECQKMPQVAIFIMNELGIVVAVKLKHFDLGKMKEI